MRNVKGKVAVITGGTSGIGLGIAKVFLQAGMKVVITYRDAFRRDQALQCLRTPDAEVHAVKMDVTDRKAVAAAADEAERAFGKVHVLCNNAGVNQLGPMDQATYADWDWMLGVNVVGVVNSLISFLPKIKAHGEGGHVVNIASMGAFITGPSAGIYATSKFAIRGLSESLQFTLAPQGIGVSLVCPGLTRSEIFRSALKRTGEMAATGLPSNAALLERLRDAHSRGMDPEEVGRKTLEGVQEDRFYVFSHPEFKNELLETFERVLMEMPEMTEVDPPRLRIEAIRMKAKADAMSAILGLKSRGD